jgi:general secretion pathway protein M
MTAQLRQMWDARSPRERWLLGVMFALIAIVLVVFAVILPLVDGLSAARERLDRATRASGQIEARIAAFEKVKRTPLPPLDGSLANVVSATAGEVGFVPDRVTPQGEDRVVIAIPAAKSTALFAWIAALETRGIFAESASIRRNADASLALEATLKRREP